MPRTSRLPAKTLVDPKTNELYVADGYGNRRVIVFDADTGNIKRHWGAYGNKPDDTNFRPTTPTIRRRAEAVPHPGALRRARQRRPALRLRPHQRPHPGLQDRRHLRQGNGFVAKDTLGDGSAFDIALSRDPQQKYLYVADGSNMKVHVLTRDTLEETHRLRRRWPPTRPVLRRPQHRHRLQRQHLHHRNLPRPAPAEVRPEGGAAGRRRWPGHALAGRALTEAHRRATPTGLPDCAARGGAAGV